MGPIPDAIVVRGEIVSAVIAVVALMVSARPLATLLGLPRAAVSDLYFNGAIVFIVAGRVVYLLLEARDSLFDPLVAVQIQTGVEPLAGAIAVLLLGAWEVSNRRDAVWPLVAGVSLGLVLATIVYDASCIVRDACYGAPAPAPLVFRMSGLADTRLATPLVEAAVLLAGLSLFLRVWPWLSWPARAAFPFAGVAILRGAFTPLSVFEAEAVGVRAYGTILAGVVAVAAPGIIALVARRDALVRSRGRRSR